MACRDVGKAKQAAVLEIFAGVKSDGLKQLVVEELDLTSFKRCAKNILQIKKQIHLLVNNAGAMACPKGKIQDIFETQFGVHHLRHFLFTSLLLPRNRNTILAHIVVNEQSALAKDPELVKELWAKSVEKVGLKDYNIFNCSKDTTLSELLKDA